MINLQHEVSTAAEPSYFAETQEKVAFFSASVSSAWFPGRAGQVGRNIPSHGAGSFFFFCGGGVGVIFFFLGGGLVLAFEVGLFLSFVGVLGGWVVDFLKQTSKGWVGAMFLGFFSGGCVVVDVRLKGSVSRSVGVIVLVLGVGSWCEKAGEKAIRNTGRKEHHGNNKLRNQQGRPLMS